MSLTKFRFQAAVRIMLHKLLLAVLPLSCAALFAVSAAAQAPAKAPAAPADPAASDTEEKSEEPAPEPVPEEPVVAPKPGETKYKTMPIVEYLRPEYFKDDKRDKSRDKELRDRVSEINKLYNLVEKDESGDAIKDEKNARMYDAYIGHLIGQLTQPDQAAEFSAHRRDLFKRHIEIIKSPAVHDRVINLVRTKMLEIVKDNYHPASRYNAMLVIGDLNQREAVRSGAPSPPEPLPQAMGDMLKELNNPAQIDAVRVACLVGILRHAEMDGQKQVLEQRWDPRKQIAVIEPMLALLSAKTPPAGRTAEGHVWMQRRAIDILAALGDVGTDGAVVKKLEAIVGDEEAAMSLRVTAAAAMGRINKLAAARIEPGDAAKKLADLAVQAGRMELARLEAEQKHRDDVLKPLTDDAGGMPRMGPGMGGPGRNMMPGMPMPGMRPGSRPPATMPPASMPRPSAGGPRGFQRPTSGGYPGPSSPMTRPTSASRMPMMPGMPGMGGGMPGMGGESPEDLEHREQYKLEVSIRRLKYELACVKTAIVGTGPVRPETGLQKQFNRDPYKTYLESLTAKIDETSKVDELSKEEKAAEKEREKDKDKDKDKEKDKEKEKEKYIKLDLLVRKLRARVAELDALARSAPVSAKAAEAAPAEAAADGPDGPDGPPAKPAPKAAPPADGPG